MHFGRSVDVWPLFFGCVEEKKNHERPVGYKSSCEIKAFKLTKQENLVSVVIQGYEGRPQQKAFKKFRNVCYRE